ncbi:MAG: MFS transporter [Lachnospiraceae bacterium]|nr:MFS transporter [Lachnospiraceae bacterium]
MKSTVRTTEEKNLKVGVMIISIVALVLFLLGLLYIYSFNNLWFMNPTAPKAIENVVYAASSSDGEVVVLEQAGTKYIRIGSDGTITQILKSSEDTFVSGKRMTMDEEGNSYIHDVRVSRGVRVGSEGIVKISSDGRNIEYLDDYEYPDNDVIRVRIVGLVPKEDTVNYLYRTEQGIQLREAGRTDVMLFPVKDAMRNVCQATLDQEREIMYFTTSDGKVKKCDTKGNEATLYDEAGTDSHSTPRDISYSPQDNCIYVADIGQRGVLKIDVDTGDVKLIEDEADFYDREIVYGVNGDNGFIGATSYGVTYINDDVPETVYEYDLSIGIKVLCAINWICFAYVALALLFVIGYGLYYLLKKAGKYTKVIVFIAIGVAALSVLIIGTLIPQFRTILPEEVYQRENLASILTTKRIPVESLEKLDSASDYNSADYEAVREAVESVFMSDTEESEDLYCSIYRIVHDQITQVYALEDSLAYYPMDWEVEGSDEESILNSGIGKRYQNRSSEGNFLFVLNPIFDDEGNAVALIEVGTDMDSLEKVITDSIIGLIINVVAIMMVSMMVIVELLYFNAGREKYAEQGGTGTLPPEIARMVVFLIFFLTNLTAAFFPLYAMDIAKTTFTFGIAPEVMAAIPISAEVVAGAVFSVMGGRVINFFGIKKGLFISTIFFSAGFVFRIIPNIWIVTLGSAMLGAGWGVILLAINTILAQMNDEDKERGFTYYSTAAMSGINAGVVFGGFLVQWISHMAVFAIVAALSLLMFALTRKYLSAEDSTVEQEEVKTGMSAITFIRKPRIFLYFIMLVVPVLIGGYFLNYMYPIIGFDYGLSETNIGYSMLISGACVLIFANPLTELFSRKRLQKAGLFISAVMYSAAFLVVALMQNIPGLLIAIVILGVADSFGLPLQTVYYTELPETEEYGYDKAIGLYSLFENAAQSIGPFVFSYVLLIGVQKGLMVVLTATLIMALIFLIFARGKKVKTGGTTNEA